MVGNKQKKGILTVYLGTTVRVVRASGASSAPVGVGRRHASESHRFFQQPRSFSLKTSVGNLAGSTHCCSCPRPFRKVARLDQRRNPPLFFWI